MGAHERIVHAELHEHDPHVLGGHTIEARQIRSSKDLSSVADLDEHVHCSLDLGI